jgi:hypothetical protein
MSLNVSSAPINTPPTSVPSYFFALLESSGGFANARLTAIDNSAVIPGTYLLEARYTGQTGNPFVGGTPLFYGQTYNVVEKAIITTSPTGAGEGIQLYVNPTSNNEAAQIPYVDAPATTGFIIPPVGFQSATISQFANTTTHNVGVAIDHMYVADTFAEAARVVPEPGTIALLAMSAVGFASLGRAKRLRQIA